MNPDRNTPPCSAPDPDDNNSHHPPLSATSPSPPVIHTGHSYVTVLSHNHQASSDHEGGQHLVPSPNSERSNSPLPASDPGCSFRSWPQFSLVSVSAPPAPATHPSCQVSVIIPSPDLHPSPLPSQCSEDTCPDLECSICFSQFNNLFCCPKMLHCKHTFCLECLARINVKSAEPSTIQCPLCCSLTPLPALGLPKLASNSDVLSHLPAAMQRVYSIRFLRNEGKLQVKRSFEGHGQGGQGSLTCSLDVGLPSPPVRDGGEAGGVGGALTRRPACLAFLLTPVVMMMVLMMGSFIYFLLTVKNENESVCSSLSTKGVMQIKLSHSESLTQTAEDFH